MDKGGFSSLELDLTQFYSSWEAECRREAFSPNSTGLYTKVKCTALLRIEMTVDLFRLDQAHSSLSNEVHDLGRRL